MLGGLYGDLPPPSTSTASSSAGGGGGGGDDDRSTSSWLSSAKLMAPPALRKPAATLLAPPQPLLRNQHQSLHKPKPSNPSPQSVRPTVVTASVLLPTDDDVVVVRSSAPSQPALVGVTSSVMEEYDPARPNDYEEYRKERKRKVAEEEMKREMERRRREEEERELELEREREKEREANQRDRERELNISGEEAWRRRAAMSSGSMGPSSSGKVPRSPSPPSNGDGFSIVKSGNSGLGIGAGGQMTAAQKMMAKMGWKEGQGLGKQEQGITTPLIAKKTDRRAGVIVNASETSKKPKSVSFNGPPTCVVLLRNMVGPGEVDDELESEVADECTKYGSVVRVLIFEITEPGFPDDEAVRIYIKFARSEDSTKALIELEGRYFGGRLVKATFFDEDKFDRNELAPMPGEIAGYF